MSVLGDITPTPPSGISEGGESAARARKSPNAFRTISEVAEDLHIPQHVLRFWETKFPQLKPLKRGGGRRYYRPEDINLLRRIGDLLYTQGYTIKGVQRLLREGGLEAVEAAGEAGEGAMTEPPEGAEGAELRACLEELESIAAALKALTAR
ncbi:MerR family transcriptional regulator [Roseomonas sp. SG15]|uniref:MerR family transcriptional regulator n=1 Tax=Roseomonas indoligenes TaxID=2820811 RepID=A0A940S6R1_9PROT|nr:MerR family transcriptional regulator [Pararoseomonas indoligenes]MBP0492268.1 MerR family transcriptional regulator [Pararoseomonas indoligenes]